MVRLSKKEERKRLKLYNQGLNDVEMAAELNVGRHAVRGWRKRRGLPANVGPGETGSIPEEEHKERLKYYNQGLSDREIGKKVHLSKTGIAYWRETHGLPANISRDAGGAHGKGGAVLTEKEHKARLKLWKAGLDDKEIAEKRDIETQTVRKWRRKFGLDDSQRLTKEQKRKFKGALGLDKLF